MIEYFTYVIDSDLQVQAYFIPIHSFNPTFLHSFRRTSGSPSWLNGCLPGRLAPRQAVRDGSEGAVALINPIN